MPVSKAGKNKPATSGSGSSYEEKEEKLTQLMYQDLIFILHVCKLCLFFFFKKKVINEDKQLRKSKKPRPQEKTKHWGEYKMYITNL